MINYGNHSRAYVAFQARFTPEMKEQLARCAEAREESQTSLIAVALRQYLGSHPVEQRAGIES